MDCPICMEAITQLNVNCVTTECGHCFHTNCLMKSIHHTGFSCPYCRNKMVEEEARENADNNDEEDDDEEDEEEEYQDEDDDMLRGFRFFYNNLAGEPHDPKDLVEERHYDMWVLDMEEIHPSSDNKPTVREIAEHLRDKGVTYEKLVYMFCTHRIEDFDDFYDTNKFNKECSDIEKHVSELMLKMEKNQAHLEEAQNE